MQKDIANIVSNLGVPEKDDYSLIKIKSFAYSSQNLTLKFLYETYKNKYFINSDHLATHRFQPDFINIPWINEVGRDTIFIHKQLKKEKLITLEYKQKKIGLYSYLIGKNDGFIQYYKTTTKLIILVCIKNYPNEKRLDITNYDFYVIDNKILLEIFANKTKTLDSKNKVKTAIISLNDIPNLESFKNNWIALENILNGSEKTKDAAKMENKPIKIKQIPEERKEAIKQWKIDNREKHLKHKADYRLKNKEQISLYNKKYWTENSIKISEKRKLSKGEKYESN